MSHRDIARAQLTIDEGRRNKPYVDTKGKVTIGIGRNLTDDGLARAEIDLLFENDLALAEQIAGEVFPTFTRLTDARKAVLMNMAFNMGQETLEQFHRTISAVTAGDYAAAADFMLQSLWAKEVGDRAVRLAQAMREG